MALALLESTTAAVDFTLGGTSYKCIASALVMDILKEHIPATTFCLPGWRKTLPGLLMATGRLDGFQSQGATISNPLTLITTDTVLAMIFTVASGCTLTGNIRVNGEHIGLVAGAGSDRSFSWHSDGAISATWVTT